MRVTLLALAALAAGAAAHMSPHKAALFATSRVRVAQPGAVAAARIVASPAVVANGDYVTLTFSSSAPSKDDLIVAWNVADDVTQTSPLEYASVPADYVSSGNGTMAFRMLNNRAPWAFSLVTGGVDNPTLLATSNAVVFAVPAEPTAVRLAVMTAPEQVRVSWTSANDASHAPWVAYWPAAGKGANATVPAQTLHIERSMFSGAPANATGYRDGGFVHTAVLVGLVPGQAYTYVVGDDTASSPAYTFTQLPTAAASPDALYPFGIAAVGDMGENTLDGTTTPFQPFPPAPNTTRLMAADVAAGLAHTVLHCGDVSYARGYAFSWDVFADNTKDITPYVTYNVDLGNHERDYPGTVAPGIVTWGNGTDSGGEAGIGTIYRFLMPVPGGLSAAIDNHALYWAAATGPVFQIHFSTELDFAAGGVVWSFVKQALASVNRSATPWVIVAFHRPMYIDSTNFSPNGGDQTVAQALRQHIEPLLMAGTSDGKPVDLVLQGHHHSYQRMSAVFNSTVNTASVLENGAHVYRAPTAPVHFVIGTGGAGYSTNTMPSPPAYVEFTSFTHGYQRITAVNASALHMQFFSDADGSLFDDAWILK